MENENTNEAHSYVVRTYDLEAFEKKKDLNHISHTSIQELLVDEYKSLQFREEMMRS